MATTTAITEADTRSISLESKVDALSHAAAYDDGSADVERIETHFAWIFLTRSCAYKLKKPIHNDIVDLRSLAARQHACQQELLLNRRLSPAVYLGLVPLVRTGDCRIGVDEPGMVVDWLVQMQRLRSALMLDRAILGGTTSLAALIDVGLRLADFYRVQPRVALEPGRYVERIARQIRNDEVALCAPELQLDSRRIHAAIATQRLVFGRMQEELASRARERHIVEAHGDLRPEHICLSDPPEFIDALEAPADLRTLDPAEELAFLWLECAQLGNGKVGWIILETYMQEARDSVSRQLLDFYASRRATVRAKLVAWHLQDPQVRHKAAWIERAHAYLDVAVERAQGALYERRVPAANMEARDEP